MFEQPVTEEKKAFFSKNDGNPSEKGEVELTQS
jgi:hypothetical protein